jgi:hypothetical protein
MKYYTEYIYKQSFVCLLYILFGGGGGGTEMVDDVAIAVATPPMQNN